MWSPISKKSKKIERLAQKLQSERAGAKAGTA
jgi:hypothetical protein